MSRIYSPPSAYRFGGAKKQWKQARRLKRTFKRAERKIKSWDDPLSDTGRIFGGKNPVQLLFRSRAAATKYAREHGAKRFSIRKVKAGR